MKFDFHVHAIVAKNIPFEIESLQKTISNARQKGLSGFALVDHIHYPGYWRTCHHLVKQFPYMKGVYTVFKDFHILSGAEINLKKEGHVLFLGQIEEILAIDKRLNLSQGYHPSLMELRQVVSSEAILIGAHPFQPFCSLQRYKPSQLQQMDALELNGSDYENNDKVREFGKVIGMPVVGGSDAHLWPLVGIGYTTLPDGPFDLLKIKDSIKMGLSRAEIEPDAKVMVNFCFKFKAQISSRYNPSPTPVPSLI